MKDMMVSFTADVQFWEGTILPECKVRARQRGVGFLKCSSVLAA